MSDKDNPLGLPDDEWAELKCQIEENNGQPTGRPASELRAAMAHQLLMKTRAELAALRADMASLHDSLNKAEQDNEALRAREAELVEALELIANLSAGGPHISAKEGMRAAFATLERARGIAEAALARVRTEKGETT